MVQPVESFDHLARLTQGLKGPLVVGFFGDFSEKSRQALPAFEAFCGRHPDVPVYVVDVGRVKDVHRRMGVTLAPTVALVKNGRLLQTVVGVRTTAEYETALLGGPTRPSGPTHAAPRPAHRVVVYTGPGCPWCTRVKAYLRQHGVPFTEIDVGFEPAQAEALVRKTGHTGVPQLDIDGKYVVGFDRPRIDALLGLSLRPEAGGPANPWQAGRAFATVERLPG